jgi:hypothetical protein
MDQTVDVRSPVAYQAPSAQPVGSITAGSCECTCDEEEGGGAGSGREREAEEKN